MSWWLWMQVASATEARVTEPCRWAPEQGTQACRCLALSPEAWWADLEANGFAKSCLDVNYVMEVSGLSPTSRLRPILEARACTLANAHGVGWKLTGLVSQKDTEQKILGTHPVEPGGLGWYVMNAIEQSTIAILGDIGLAPQSLAFVVDWDGSGEEDDLLILFEDEETVWVAEGPFDPDEVLYPLQGE